MATCYCGCGSKIGTFATSQRSANKVGRLVAESLQHLETELRPQLAASADGEGVLEICDARIQTGRIHEADCRAVVHETKSFGGVNWPEVRAWVRDAQGMTSFLRLPSDQQQRVVRSTPHGGNEQVAPAGWLPPSSDATDPPEKAS